MESMKRSDIKLYERAMKQRWPISDQHRADIVNQLMGVVNSPMATERDKTSAARALMSAEAMNQSDEQHAADEFREMILNYANQRGITIADVGGAIEGGTVQRLEQPTDSGDTEEAS